MPTKLRRSRRSRVAWAVLAFGSAGACVGELGPVAGSRETGAGPDAAVALAPATLAALRELSPDQLPPPPPDRTNRYADDPAAAALGQRWFFDPGFSGALLDPDNRGDRQSLGVVGQTGRVACAGCHVPSAGFLDSRSSRQQISLGAGWTQRHARSLLDVGQARIVMWDGRHDALWNQPFEALENPRAMNSSRLYAAEEIYRRYRAQYEAIFGAIPIALDDAARFPQLTGATTGCRRLDGNNDGVDCHGVPGDHAEYDGLQSDQDRVEVTRVVVNVGKALAAYERLLSCGPSRFDRWMHGEADALTASEQRGAALFVGQRADGSTGVGCNACHSGPFLTDQGFHNVGLAPTGVGIAGSFYDRDDRGAFEGLAGILGDAINVRGPFSDGDDGRLPATVEPRMDGAFRTPSLRCVGRRPTFMHTGQIVNLVDVVAFFDRGGDASGFPGASELVARHFTPDERADLVAFLNALDGPGPAAALLEPPSPP
jgi:cytochrome c peroxidase